MIASSFAPGELWKRCESYKSWRRSGRRRRTVFLALLLMPFAIMVLLAVFAALPLLAARDRRRGRK